uniref:EGF domain-specific O-linked N-acetylglucosamine transferase n=1 Tax=Strongyloides stercoralis TaxID=6248 RepID=A0A0K0EG94_STRER
MKRKFVKRKKKLFLTKLVELLKNDFNEELEVQLVDYNSKIPFLKQIEISHNTDIFIGIHGSGLTHLLFLPDWAAIFEIYNCDDPNCYSDLARLRGVKYFTWPRHLIEKGIKPLLPSINQPKDIPHKKFLNYNVDEELFKKEFIKIKEYVKRHPLYVDGRRKIRRNNAINKKKEL